MGFRHHLAQQQFRGPKCRKGSNSAAPVTGCRDRYTSDTGLECGQPWRPFRAIRDQSAPQQNDCYSITSSASAVKSIGTASPRALAVLELMTSSNFTGAWTGSSLGLAPFKMRSV